MPVINYFFTIFILVHQEQIFINACNSSKHIHFFYKFSIENTASVSGEINSKPNKVAVKYLTFNYISGCNSENKKKNKGFRTKIVQVRENHSRDIICNT